MVVHFTKISQLWRPKVSDSNSHTLLTFHTVTNRLPARRLGAPNRIIGKSKDLKLTDNYKYFLKILKKNTFKGKSLLFQF